MIMILSSLYTKLLAKVLDSQKFHTWKISDKHANLNLAIKMDCS